MGRFDFNDNSQEIEKANNLKKQFDELVNRMFLKPNNLFLLIVYCFVSSCQIILFTLDISSSLKVAINLIS